MNLLLDEVHVLETAGDPTAVDVLDIEHDSRRVRPGTLFCCLPGRTTDGHRHAADAVTRGAVGLVCEHFVDDPPAASVVQVRVPEGDARVAMAQVAAAFYGYPARDLRVAGVTGTNGKTTVTRLLAAALDAQGWPTTVVGTLGGTRTTPESPALQRILSGVRDRQRADGRAHAVSLEVSSHALVQARVDGIHFDVAAFTNLSHDHLDFHGSMEEYARAKASLFVPERTVCGVVYADDEWGQWLLDRARVPVVPVHRDDARDVVLAPARTEFTWRGRRVTLPLTGGFNVANALVAAEAAVALGADVDRVVDGLASAPPPPGRMEVVDWPGDAAPEFTVLVDYAHTPAGLAAVLAAARELAAPGGRVLAVFGCGGDRDRAKRPVMGEVATRLADRAYLTSDNPRHEDPAAILSEVARGVPSGADLVVEADRRAAIGQALLEAARGDVVVVAGKGHETAQQVGDERRPFDDRQVAAELLAHRLGAPVADDDGPRER